MHNHKLDLISSKLHENQLSNCVIDFTFLKFAKKTDLYELIARASGHSLAVEIKSHIMDQIFVLSIYRNCLKHFVNRRLVAKPS
jgi:hypothetical protein